MSRTFPLLLALLLAPLCALAPRGRAYAEDTVLLLEHHALRPGLCSALRIQLAGLASVRCRPDLDDALPARLAHASREVARDDAHLGVLLEHDPDPALVRMYLVGGTQGDRAVLEIERIEDRAAPEVDRSLALKVRETLETLLALPPAVVAPLAVTLAPEPPRAAVAEAETLARTPSPREEARFSALLEAGAGITLGTRRRAVGAVLAGARVARRALGAELAVGGRLSGPAHVRSRWGVVDESEWGLVASLRGHVAVGRFRLGVLAEVGYDRLTARGVTPSGTVGEARAALAHVGAGLDLRVRLRGDAWLRLAPTVELDPIAHRFALDERVVLDRGRVRAVVPLSLLIELPLFGDRHAR